MIEASLCRLKSLIIKNNNAGMKLLTFAFQLCSEHSLIFDILSLLTLINTEKDLPMWYKKSKITTSTIKIECRLPNSPERKTSQHTASK